MGLFSDVWRLLRFGVFLMSATFTDVAAMTGLVGSLFFGVVPSSNTAYALAALVSYLARAFSPLRWLGTWHGRSRASLQ